MPLDSNDIPLVLREIGLEAKGSPLSNSEVDNNFISLRTGILSISSEVEDLQTDVATIKNSNPWTPSNDGPGSGLDADTLDGKHLSEIVMEVATNVLPSTGGTLTGDLVISKTSPLVKFNDVSDAGIDLALGAIGETFYLFEPEDSSGTQVPGNIGRQWIKIEDDDSGVGNVFVFENNKVWHSGNDGSDSGLDADTLDGLHASSFYTTAQSIQQFISRSGDTMTGKLTLKTGADFGLAFNTGELEDSNDSVKFTVESLSAGNISAKLTVGNDPQDNFSFVVPTNNSVLINGAIVLTSSNYQDIIGEVGGEVSGPVTLGVDTIGNYVSNITGTTNQVNISGSGLPTANVVVSLPQDIHNAATPVFGGATLNSISVGIETPNEINTTSGNLMLDSAGGTVDVGDNLYVEGNLSVVGNLTVNGTTITVNTTTFSVDDPIITLGGTSTPTLDDSKDRGVEFRWHDGANGKVGFFGFDDSTGKFTFIPDAINTSEVFTGSKGTIDAFVDWTNITSKPVFGTLATQNSNSVAITGGNITGITDLAIADGGTGASTAADARTNILPSYVDNASKFLAINSGATDVEWVTLQNPNADVVSITASDNNSIVRFDGDTGKIIKNSLATIDDFGVGRFPAITLQNDLAIADGGTGASTAADARTNLGLGDIATQNSNNVAITGGVITGITDLAIADGGTGASTAADARTNILPSYANNIGKVLAINSTATDVEWKTLETGGDVSSPSPSVNNSIVRFDGTTGKIIKNSLATIDDTGAGTFSSISLQNDLAIADGGTGASTAADARTNLGLGTLATQNSNNALISGGNITGITDLAIADGGTGASTAADARTNLGLGTLATQNSNSVAIIGGTITGTTTLIDPIINGTILEDIFIIIDGNAFEIDPGNGSIQLITLGANRTPKATYFSNGESITLMILDGPGFTLTWTDTSFGANGIVWVGGSAPSLDTTKYTVIELWKVANQVYGAFVGVA